jgi:predicted Zn finger-like uncharacterized protein
MRFVCDSCRAQYMISDDKIGAKGVKIRCKKCGHVIVVRPAGAAAPKDEGAPAVEAAAAAPSNGAATSNAANGLAALGTPPEGGLFTDVEEDEIGAVFDQVLSGSQKIPGGEPARESKPSTPDAVRKLAEAEDEPEEPKAAAPANDWYVAIDDKQVGPLTVDKVKEHWDQGEVGPDSLCWRQGFGDWIPLSEVKELASVLAPRPAKPVIVAPSPVSASVPAVSAPVESAFSAGAAAKNTRPEIPAAPALGQEPTSSGWKPSAASVLASLVKEENEALSKPPPKPAAEEKPAVPGLLDLPPEPAMAPAARAAPMLTAVEPMRAPQPAPMPYAPPAPAPAYAQPAPAYAQPAYASAGYPQPAYPGYPPPAAGAQGGGNKTMMFAGIAVAAVAVLGIGGYFAFGRSSPQPQPQPPVAVAAVTPTPQPTPPVPEVKAQPAATPAVANPTTPTPAPGTPPAPAAAVAAAPGGTPATTPAPAVTPPPATTPAPPPASEAVATRPNPGTREPRERTGSRTGSRSEGRSEARSETKSESVGSAAAPPKASKSDDVGDDFDDLFGPKKTEKKSSGSQASSTPSTYIPPEPGGGANIPERLGQSDIMAVVLANKGSIVKCVNEQKKRDPGVSGKLVMHWMIQTSGRTTGVAVKSDEFKKTYMASCISGLIKGWTFPKHKKQGDPIDFPFTF